MRKEIKVLFMGGKQAGCIGLVTLLAAKCEIVSAVAYDEKTKAVCEELGLQVFSSIHDKGFDKRLHGCDLLVSVHGREIIPSEMLKIPSLGCINVHPCLYQYKGSSPVEKLLRDGNTKASVGVHYMTEDVDSGEVITELFIDVSGKKTVEEVYNTLYPYYILSILKAIDKINE